MEFKFSLFKSELGDVKNELSNFLEKISKLYSKED